MNDDAPREACGIFGIYAPGEEVARLTFFGLFALQHRGQESAGIAVSGGSVAHVHKGMGLVSQVFTEDNLHPLRGHLAIGHTRYSTTGAPRLRNAQPYLIETQYGPLGVAHNGNLVNAAELRRELLHQGVGLMSATDSEVMAMMLARASGGKWKDRLAEVMPRWRGAYSLIVLTRNRIYAARDPWGFRPLCIGKLNGSGYVVASESCALTTVGAEFIREVAPGEVISLDERGLRSRQAFAPQTPALCTFEHIYFSRPDSQWDGRSIHQVRQRLGAELAREAPVPADLVIAVPDSATPAAIGFAHASGIPFTEGLVKNRYIGRTFIQPTDRLRQMGVALKLNTLADNLSGKRVVLVDDSIVRGTTAGPIVKLLRKAGATTIHLRVTCPPIRHPCFMGVDMASREELIACRMSVEQTREHLGCDSLHYLSLEGMMRAIGHEGYCNACFTGRYPIDIPADQDKNAFEGSIE